jgi:DnaJ-domain-containing protein 1
MIVAVECPRCEKALVNDLRHIHGSIGILRWGQITTRIIIGCRSCVRRGVLEALAKNVLLGWWWIAGPIVTPFFFLEHIWALLTPPNEATLRAGLERAGLPVDRLRLDAAGLTGEQKAFFEAVMTVLVQSVWADGTVDPREVDAGVDIAARLFEGIVDPYEIRGRILLRKTDGLDPSLLQQDERLLLLRVAVAIALADGRLAPGELHYLRDLARLLSLPHGVVDRLLKEATGQTRGSTGAGRESQATPQRGLLAEAAKVLGIPIGATTALAKRAFRRAAMRSHPDRVGNSEESNKRMAKLNWAYSQFVEHGTLA